MFGVHLARVDATEDVNDNIPAVTSFIEAVGVERALKAAVRWCSPGDEKHRAHGGQVAVGVPEYVTELCDEDLTLCALQEATTIRTRASLLKR